MPAWDAIRGMAWRHLGGWNRCQCQAGNSTDLAPIGPRSACSCVNPLVHNRLVLHRGPTADWAPSQRSQVRDAIPSTAGKRARRRATQLALRATLPSGGALFRCAIGDGPHWTLDASTASRAQSPGRALSWPATAAQDQHRQPSPSQPGRYRRGDEAIVRLSVSRAPACAVS